MFEQLGLNVYSNSVVKKDGTTYSLARDEQGHKVLVTQGDTAVGDNGGF